MQKRHKFTSFKIFNLLNFTYTPNEIVPSNMHLFEQVSIIFQYMEEDYVAKTNTIDNVYNHKFPRTRRT